MGGFSSWLKKAFKPPKALRKLKLGRVVAAAVTGGPGAAIGEVQAQGAARQAERDMKAAQAAADAEAIAAAQANIVTLNPHAAPESAEVSIFGGIQKPSTAVIVAVAAVVVVIVVVAARRR